MIKSYDGQLSIEGNRVQVLLDFDHIIVEMCRIAPEIVTSVLAHNVDALEQVKIDPIDLAICDKVLNTVDSAESEDSDDEDFIL